MSRVGLVVGFMLYFSAVHSQQASPFTFLSIGDWGGAAISPSVKENVYAVARSMRKTAAAQNAQFVISTGDNFYWCGVQDVNDFQFQTDYVEPYQELNLPWYNSLGNHEYAYNVSAQIEYSHMNENWILPARYYSKRIAINEEKGVYMTIITLDTSPCIAAYRGPQQSEWDPCSTTHPTCSFDDTDDDFGMYLSLSVHFFLPFYLSSCLCVFSQTCLCPSSKI